VLSKALLGTQQSVIYQLHVSLKMLVPLVRAHLHTNLAPRALSFNLCPNTSLGLDLATRWNAGPSMNVCGHPMHVWFCVRALGASLGINESFKLPPH
jgi:hypothetical protein